MRPSHARAAATEVSKVVGATLPRRLELIADAVVQRACLNAGAALPLELYDGLLQRPNIALRLLMLFLWRRTQHG